ncbi:MAG: amino acid kinase family protein [Candidatus Thorarchaeota archaeon]|jgi:aspartokinase-like uncharacterized kinase
MKIVLKIGGSLATNPKNLKDLLRTIAGFKQDENSSIIIIPGGGPFTDAVREYQNVLEFSEDAAHWMAILGQDQYGLLLAELFPNAKLVESPEQILDVMHDGVNIVLPYRFLRMKNELPHSWNVTGDSIALWFGIVLKADYVVLLKSVDGIMTTGTDRKSKHLDEVNASELDIVDRAGVVDDYFAELVPRFEGGIFILNGRKPELISSFLSGKKVAGTRIR